MTENAELELLNALCPVIATAGDNGRLLCPDGFFRFLVIRAKQKRAAGAGKF
ncbi:MAG: hypothetical protein ACLURV_00825 [Gallintestinimicrobium sp.]